MSTEQQHWSDYARALRQIATARTDAQQARDRLTANRSRAEATAMAEAEAMAERGRTLEERLNALVGKAADSLERAGVPAEGKRIAITLPTVRGIADVEAAAAQLTRQLGDAVERLEELRREAGARRERRRRRTVSAALVLVAFGLVWAARGSVTSGLQAAGIVVLTLVAGLRLLAGSPRVAWAAAVAVVVLTASQPIWWLAMIVPVAVAGVAVVLPRRRTQPVASPDKRK
jgi:hypothetical protein